jgi:Cof subfamily protein (haloacid dehalogenase superfamily)
LPASGGALPYDLVAFDLDGTVLPRDLVISERTLRAVGELRGRGARVVVATGRRFETAKEHATTLGLGEDDPVVCYGGSMVRCVGGETLLHRTLPRDVGAEVLDWAAERDLHARIFTDGHIITAQDNSAVMQYIRREEPGVFAVQSPAYWLRNGGEEPIKLVLVDYPEGVEVWLEEAREAFSGRLFVTRSLPHYVEVGGLKGKKSAALEFLCERWGIEPSRVLAFGDADNDIDMLRFAGTGVAVGPMTEEVRAAADHVVPPVDEDGVAGFLEELLGGAARA